MPHELVLPPTEGEHHGAGAAESTPGEGRATPASPASPAPPLTLDEYDSIVSTIWTDLDDDLGRFGDLLADALGFIGGLALAFDIDPVAADRATAVLRAMEQRALWGPNHEQEDHR